MTSSEKRPSEPSPSPLSGRSFLSRLRSPLSSKTRNWTEFYIQADDPHRQYAPGDIISGTVIIKIVKPLRVTHLVVSLHGYAQVFKNPNAPGDAYKNYCSTVGSGKGKKSGSYFGNGFVSLFEDEVVLCGEGRLSEGVYHFNFELEFPSKGLPSSIEFERGTVAYKLTSTLTRPTTMSPIASCHTNVHLMDVIDIAQITNPKPRAISLEPISRRTRPKPSRKRTNTTSDKPQTPTGTERVQLPQTQDNLGTPDQSEGPRSPSPSDVSFESQISSGNASGTEYGIRSVNTATDGFSLTSRSQTTLKGKTITATIDVLKGGFLRGDQVPIRVRVNHTKHIRSLKGIIVTLYRQARVDMHPALPVVPNSKGDKRKSEDYYPKSRTGLGGLSLSSAGSSHTFRKDLSQTFAPLFVDPRTFTADVKCSVRVPDEAFPTMSNVPGAMISFKYYAEVIVDIQGKLTGLDRVVANAGLVPVPATSGGPPGHAQSDGSGNMFSSWGGNFVDTDQIRREKGVISCLFEVIIGTKDTERTGKKKQMQVPGAVNGDHDPATAPDGAFTPGEHNPGEYQYDENGNYYDYGYDPEYYDAPEYDPHNLGSEPAYHPPLSTVHEEQGLSEKERLQRAEARLLPSQPPDASGAPISATQHGIPASAPVLNDDDYNSHSAYFAAGSSSSAPSHPPPNFAAATTSLAPSASPSIAPSIPTIIQRPSPLDDDNRTTTTGSSLTIHAPTHPTPISQSVSNNSPGNATTYLSKPLPSLPPPSPLTTTTPDAAPEYSAPSSSTSHMPPADDKQELQRRRLEMERSAPPDLQHTDAANELSVPLPPPPLRQGQGVNGINRVNGVSRGQAPDLAPSAPVLDDEDEGLVEAVRPGTGAAGGRPLSEALPEYRR